MTITNKQFMNKIIKTIVYSFGILSSAGIVNAFGYFRNSDMYDFMGMSGFGMFVGFGVAAVLIGVLLFVFWLWMLVDCLKRDFKKDVEKVAWILVMIFLHILGAIIYYFVVKAGDKKVWKEKKK